MTTPTVSAAEMIKSVDDEISQLSVRVLTLQEALDEAKTRLKSLRALKEGVTLGQRQASESKTGND